MSATARRTSVFVPSACRYDAAACPLIDLNSASTFTDGRTFTCTFTINSNAPSGTYGINGNRNHVSDPHGSEFPSTVSNGSVRVL